MSNEEFMKEVKRSGGKHCPCCEQFAKIYKRKLNSEIAYGLIQLHRMTVAAEEVSTDAYAHVSQIMKGYGLSGGGDFAKAEMWGLIYPMENRSTHKRTSGMWKITPKGSAFVVGVIKVPSHVIVYNKKKQGFSDDEITIREALHKRFNYIELMKS